MSAATLRRMPISDDPKGSPSPRIDESEFKRGFLNQFQDPVYGPLKAELSKVAVATWHAYASFPQKPKDAQGRS